MNYSIRITDGIVSFGKSFLEKFRSRYPDIWRFVVFSRDELKQWKLQQKFHASLYPPPPQLHFFFGDILDQDCLRCALRGIDIVVHAQALKQVPATEYNPIEFINTNVMGAENAVQACIDSEVKRDISLITDKAAAPVNLYGKTKLCSDNIFAAINNISGRPVLRSKNF